MGRLEVLPPAFTAYEEVIDSARLSRDLGTVSEIHGFLIKGKLPGARIGSTVMIPSDLGHSVEAEVVGFENGQVLMMPLEACRGIGLGSKLILKQASATVKISADLLGRVIDPNGKPMDGLGPLDHFQEFPIYKEIRNPLLRRNITEHIDIGIRAINSALSVGQGQRVSIMAGSGVGKSVLLGMIAKQTDADVIVIAMIGERGREVREFIENELGPEGLKKSVVVCATSDQSPLLRMRGAFVATTIAEYFCSLGKNVLLLMDSVTRFAMAQREVGLSSGEPPTTKGYTPSVFSLLPKLLERAGSFENEGSITGLYTTLVEADDMNDPIGDAVRSIVDGHIVLSRNLAQKGHFPAIDILASNSRVMRAVTTAEHQKLAMKIRETLATYKEAEDLIQIGAYKPGSVAAIDRAIELMPKLESYLRQGEEEDGSWEMTLHGMQKIFNK